MAKKSDDEKLHDFREKVIMERQKEVAESSVKSKAQIDGKEQTFNHETGGFE